MNNKNRMKKLIIFKKKLCFLYFKNKSYITYTHAWCNNPRTKSHQRIGQVRKLDENSLQYYITIIIYIKIP